MHACMQPPELGNCPSQTPNPYTHQTLNPYIHFLYSLTEANPKPYKPLYPLKPKPYPVMTPKLLKSLKP